MGAATDAQRRVGLRERFKEELKRQYNVWQAVETESGCGLPIQ